jgi:hypothetical protein
MKFSATLLLLPIIAASSASAYSISGTSLMAATFKGASMQMAPTCMGVHFGCMGRLATGFVMEDADCKLAAINAGSGIPDNREYLMRYPLAYRFIRPEPLFLNTMV